MCYIWIEERACAMRSFFADAQMQKCDDGRDDGCEADMLTDDVIDKAYRYGQGQGGIPTLSELSYVIRELSERTDSEDGADTPTGGADADTAADCKVQAHGEAAADAEASFERLRRLARKLTDERFGNRIYIRGLIEFTNICRNDCYYCGIRKSNGKLDRYRLSAEQIAECADEGYELGFRTFVLQGGEDGGYTDGAIAGIVSRIKERHPDCAVTLSCGEHSYETYKLWRRAGADRYLLRHETANKEHYERLHPSEMNYDNRVRCLYDLKELGYQVGSGFMVGSPYQTAENLAEDLYFLARLAPQMIGIGPYVPHRDTPFAGHSAGTLRQTLLMLSLLRVLFPKALIPATTSLGTIASDGREKGFMHGANVIMPNLSPVSVREKYSLYDNKICTGEESAQCRACMDRRAESYGFRLVVDRGDYSDEEVRV